VTSPIQNRPGGDPRSRAPSDGRASPARGDGRKAIVALVLAAGAIVCANLSATRLSWRLDLTDDGVFTLSPASRALVRALPDELTIKAYVSRDLPPALGNVARYARELLEEYRLASQGKLRYQIEDPASNPRVEEQAGRCRIGKIAVETKTNAKRAVGQYFLGLCLWYDGKSRAMSPIDQGAGLEYQISALIKVMSERRRKIAFTAGHGERDLGTEYSFVRHALELEQDVVTLDPSVNPLGDDLDLLVIAGPRRPFDGGARRAIDAFLAKGRPAIFLIDGMEADGPPDAGDGRRIPRAVETGLEPLLEAYGFRVGHDLIFDRLNVTGPIGGGGGAGDGAAPPLFVNFPAFLVTRPDPALARDLSITAGIDALVFPFASSIELVGPLAGGAPAEGRIWTLARSSPEAWRQTAPFSLTQRQARPAEATAAGPLALAYAYQGRARRALADAGPVRPTATATASTPPVRLVVLGDSDLVSDRYMSLLRTFPIYAGSAQLLLNAVSWTLEDDALTALRARVLRARPLAVEGDDAARATLLRWGNVAGLPIAVCAAGLLRWRWRTAARRRQRLPGARTRSS
jgi:ABC-type uncharacterized transport system involved in gliding motility auxiliary subunit